MAKQKPKQKPKKKPVKKKAAVKRKPVKKTSVPKLRAAGNVREKNISVREIENGFIVNESWTTPKGSYKSKETFTKIEPTIQIKG